jgi:hypothetical protein
LHFPGHAKQLYRRTIEVIVAIGTELPKGLVSQQRILKKTLDNGLKHSNIISIKVVRTIRDNIGTVARLKQNVSISLDKDKLATLNEIAERTKIKRSVLIEEGVDAIINKYQPQLRLHLGRQVLKNQGKK